MTDCWRFLDPSEHLTDDGFKRPNEAYAELSKSNRRIDAGEQHSLTSRYDACLGTQRADSHQPYRQLGDKRFAL